MMSCVCPPQVRLAHPLFRVLAFGMILVLLVARFGSLTEEVLVTPIEDAIFDVAFMVDAKNDQLPKFLFNKAKYQLDCDITQGQIPVQVPLPAFAIKPEHVPVFVSRDFVAEIFIPPEGGS